MVPVPRTGGDHRSRHRRLRCLGLRHDAGGTDHDPMTSLTGNIGTLSPGHLAWRGLLASLVAGLGTGAGALGVFFVRRLSDRLEDALLSWAAGIMLAASFFSLLLPAIDQGERQFASRNVAVLSVIVGLLAGAYSI
jgi:hypothetical protein